MNLCHRYKVHIAALLLCSSFAIWADSSGLRTIELDNPNIEYRGIQYLDIQPDLVKFSRFDPKLLELGKPELGFNPLKARNTTGAVIAFQTDSPTVRLSFRPVPGLNRGAEFAVFINGKLTESFKFGPKQQDLSFQLEHQEERLPAFWEVTLPSFANVELVSLEIEKDTHLAAITEPERKTHVALGDSITHGTGQGSATHLTWPFVLSRQLDFTLYNLAVGGSGVSVAAGQSLNKFDKLDLITILLGFNDWSGEGDTAEEFKNQYRALIHAIRGSQPNTPVFCISPLVTRRSMPKKGSQSLEGFRIAIQQLVKELSPTDPNLYFIDGESISSFENLRPLDTGDPVHLSATGAELFANALYPLIIEKLE